MLNTKHYIANVHYLI